MEGRKFHRLLLEIDIDYTKDSENAAHHSKTKNISSGGICITTHNKPLDKNRTYQLQFTLPEQSEPVDAQGRVVWHNEYVDGGERFIDNGIEFIDMSDKYHEMIEEYSIGSVSPGE